ncbi:MAG: ChbG/HpnK family deacetylase [Candidatus Peribacteraceae bacterium]|nr:ChbG/HpnK family deacetylase [Candidatus Peribacteraceae bacterium]
MRRLIINADDLGANSARTHGIFQCFEFGIVTSATLLCNGSDAAQAAKHGREKKLPTGLHLNLTDGPPISDAQDVETLLSSTAGEFREQGLQRRALDEGQIDAVHLEREIRAQIEWFLDHHGQPTHLDSHHSFHTHPFIVPLLIPILQRYGIRFVRIQEDLLPPFGFQIPEERVAVLQKKSAEAASARGFFASEGIGSTDHFRGLALAGNASAKNLRHIVTRLPEGTTELMVHPGSMTPIGTPFDLDPQRQTELQMLTNPDVPVLLKERKIELISYADL